MCRQSLAANDLHSKVVYPGPEKFWTLQWRELGVFLVASAVLVIFCSWWIRRRVT